LGLEPGASGAPVALDGAHRDAQHFRGFLLRQTAEIQQFDEACPAAVPFRQPAKGLIENKQLFDSRAGCGHEVVEFDSLLAAGALGGGALASVIHQDAAHDDGGGGEKVRAALPVRGVVAQQPQISFVYQGGGLKGVVGTLPPHEVPGEGAELVVDQGDQIGFGAGVTAPQGRKHDCDFAGGRHHLLLMEWRDCTASRDLGRIEPTRRAREPTGMSLIRWFLRFLKWESESWSGSDATGFWASWR